MLEYPQPAPIRSAAPARMPAREIKGEAVFLLFLHCNQCFSINGQNESPERDVITWIHSAFLTGYCGTEIKLCEEYKHSRHFTFMLWVGMGR